MMDYLYIIVIFWSGLLIAWSAVVGIAIIQIMANVHKTGHNIRRTDTSNFVVVLFTGIAQFLALFVFNDLLVNLADTALIANTWYTLYLCSITYTNISIWPSLMTGNVVRAIAQKNIIYHRTND